MNQSSELSPEQKFAVEKVYLIAANAVSETEPDNKLFQIGPVLNSVGLATELILKSILSAHGFADVDLKKFEHNLPCLLKEVWRFVNSDTFEKTISAQLEGFPVPANVRARMETAEETDIESKWKHYPSQLNILNDIYDRPYWTRYPTTNSIVLPELTVLLAGADVLKALHTNELNRRKREESR